MKSFSFAKALTLGCLVCLSLPIACGDDDDDGGPSKPGDGGAGGESANPTAGKPATPAGGEGGVGGADPGLSIPGTSPTSKSIECGTATCTSVKTAAPGVFVDPCCVDDACGLNPQFFLVVGAQFPRACEALAQPGPVDEACPNSPDQMLPVSGMSYLVPGFAGCCRADTGTCGVVADQITATIGPVKVPFATTNLGCVDSAPFFQGVPGKACGDALGGAGGVGGAGGASAGGAGGAGGAL